MYEDKLRDFQNRWSNIEYINDLYTLNFFFTNPDILEFRLTYNINSYNVNEMLCR